MLGVVLVRGARLEGAQLERDQAQALALDPAQHLADQAAAHAVGLDEDKGALGVHATPSLGAGGGPGGDRRERTRQTTPSGAARSITAGVPGDAAAGHGATGAG